MHAHPLHWKLLNLAATFLLTQVVHEPIHFSHSGVPSTIDFIRVSCPSSILNCNTVAPLSNSDHNGSFYLF